MKNYNVDWSKTIENIGFMLYDRTHKKNLSDAFNLDDILLYVCNIELFELPLSPATLCFSNKNCC